MARKNCHSRQRLSGALLGPIRDEHPLAGRVEGIEVLDVERGSPAWSTGIRAGDIIVAVNRQPVETVAEISAALARNPSSLRLDIRRGNGTLILVIQ